MIDPGHVNLVFALSLLLASGFALARLVKLAHLPSVTGYILAGGALGPSGLNWITRELTESRLEVFTNIALMLVAFGIGERFDLQQLRHSARALARISFGECAATFVLVGVAVGATASVVGAGGAAAGPSAQLALALICASIAVATAPAATVAVIREIEASGPVTRLVLSNVVVNNALSVTLFGVAVAAARALLGTSPGAGAHEALAPVVSTAGSLLLGLGVGLVTDLAVHRLSQRADVLIVALAAVFFCGGLATFLGLSSLLAGVAAGFAVVNRDRRDVRAFRALNDFEPPLYGIFFTLAGAQLHLGEMAGAGALGAAFVVARAAGKYLGAWWGARSAGLPPLQSRTLGLGLLPQAGLAIGLAYLVRQDPSLGAIRSLVINIVIASVVVNELVGPPLVRLMAALAGELPAGESDNRDESPPAGGPAEVVPWAWPKITPAPLPEGYVLFGLSHPGTAAGVTRIATLLSHYYRAQPLAVHVVTGDHSNDFWENDADRRARNLFRLARQEAASLGYGIHTDAEVAEETADGILRVADSVDAQAIVLGHPFARRAPAFARIVDAVARDSTCPVVVVKFAGALHTERILAALGSLEDVASVYPLLCALAMVSEHQITVLQLMAHETGPEELTAGQAKLEAYLQLSHLPGTVTCRAVAAESRVHEVLEAAREHDIVVMSASDQRGLRRAFFGSLAEDVAQRIDRPILLGRDDWSPDR